MTLATTSSAMECNTKRGKCSYLCMSDPVLGFLGLKRLKFINFCLIGQWYFLCLPVWIHDSPHWLMLNWSVVFLKGRNLVLCIPACNLGSLGRTLSDWPTTLPLDCILVTLDRLKVLVPLIWSDAWPVYSDLFWLLPPGIWWLICLWLSCRLLLIIFLIIFFRWWL